MADAIDGYRELERQELTDAYRSRLADPNYESAVAQAAARGYRPATLSEILESALSGAALAEDLYTWRGGVWAKIPDGQS